MTREQQVKAALKLSELPRHRHEAARASIENALDQHIFKVSRSAAHTRALKVYRRRRLQLESAHKALCIIERSACSDAHGMEYVPTKDHPSETWHYELYPGAGGRWKQAFAVALAYALLMKWWGSEELIKTTRKGPWWRLSAILYGDPTYDLFRHLRAFKPELSPTRRI
jgi:hypothetical protein